MYVLAFTHTHTHTHTLCNVCACVYMNMYLRVVFVHGDDPLAESFCCSGSSPDLGRVKLLVGSVVLADPGYDLRVDVVLIRRKKKN